MKILVVGSGGREHALLWKLNQDLPDAEFFIAGGNGGTEAIAKTLPIAPSALEELARWAKGEGIDLTVVGPEVPLAEGIVDRFTALDLPIFGPTQAAAEIESSKAFSKALMQRHKVPTAAFETFSDAEAAAAYIRSRPAPIVVKASGLAAGKGAVVCATREEALATVEEILSKGIFGHAGSEVVIEEFMHGEELSVFALSDGEHVVTLLAAQDHKCVGEGDTGPNTGGMGAYAPVSIATPELLDRIEREILIPTVQALAEEGRPYRGILYAGLMLTEAGPKVVEFNCRFGDPEAQVLLPLLESSLFELLEAVANGRSVTTLSPIRWKAGAAVTTVLASGGYPGEFETGIPITIPDDLESDDVLLFHGGTARRNGELVTTGGRVLSVTGVGADVAEAAARSREAAARIEFAGSHFRNDIGWREVAREER